MEIAKKRRLVDVLYGFYLLCHPGPVLFHLLAVTLLILLAAWPHLVWSTIVLLVAAHTVMQLSIAILNDYCDSQRDTLSKKHKLLRDNQHPKPKCMQPALVSVAVRIRNGKE